MVRLVVRLSPLAKGAALVALVGGVLWIWGGLKEIGWATAVGTVVFLGGAIVYYIERFRMFRRRRDREETPE
ncbi:MAG: hypothetical protein ACYTDU_09235 [Planctomycetota bacterium]